MEQEGTRAWLVAMGLIPASLAFAGLALAASTPAYFWEGIAISCFGVAWGLWDWWKTTQRKIVSLLAFIAIGAFIGCILLKQAPMDVAMESLESDYPPGAEVVGIQWQSIFSELRATVTNQSNDIYSDIDILVRTDLTIPEVGIIARFGQCVAEPVKVLEADVHWESGGKKGDLRHGMKGAQVLLAPFIKFIAIDYSLKTEWKLSFPW